MQILGIECYSLLCFCFQEQFGQDRFSTLYAFFVDHICLTYTPDLDPLRPCTVSARTHSTTRRWLDSDGPGAVGLARFFSSIPRCFPILRASLLRVCRLSQACKDFLSKSHICISSLVAHCHPSHYTSISPTFPLLHPLPLLHPHPCPGFHLHRNFSINLNASLSSSASTLSSFLSSFLASAHTHTHTHTHTATTR